MASLLGTGEEKTIVFSVVVNDAPTLVGKFPQLRAHSFALLLNQLEKLREFLSHNTRLVIDVSAFKREPSNPREHLLFFNATARDWISPVSTERLRLENWFESHVPPFLQRQVPADPTKPPQILQIHAIFFAVSGAPANRREVPVIAVTVGLTVEKFSTVLAPPAGFQVMVSVPPLVTV